MDVDGSVNEQYCSSLLRKLVSMDAIPRECRQFASFRAALTEQQTSKKKTKGGWDTSAFVGMNAGEALGAQSARQHGRLNQAQILRRMSTRSKSNESSWF